MRISRAKKADFTASLAVVLFSGDRRGSPLLFNYNRLDLHHLHLQLEIIAYHCDEFTVCRFASFILDSISEI